MAGSKNRKRKLQLAPLQACAGACASPGDGPCPSPDLQETAQVAYTGRHMDRPSPKLILEDLNLEAAECRLCVAALEHGGNIVGAANSSASPDTRSSAG